MKIGFLINDFESLVASQTTAMLLYHFAQRGDEVFVFGVKDIHFAFHDSMFAKAKRVYSQSYHDKEEVIRNVKQIQSENCLLLSLDCLLIRTNPGRDKGSSALHEAALQFCSWLSEKNVLVLNEPRGLLKAQTKSYLAWLPYDLVPQTIVSTSKKDILDFQKKHGAIVMKPLSGSRGEGVFVLREENYFNHNQLVDAAISGGYVMCQEFITNAEEGDIRVVVADGKVLEEKGAYCAVHRVPASGDFRSNIHAGGEAIPATLSDELLTASNRIAQILLEEGIFLAGLDFVQGKLIEANVYSTGGFRDAERFTGVSFVSKVAEMIERKIRKYKLS